MRATDVESLGADGMRFNVHADGESAAARIALLGEHNVYNALAAVAVGSRRALQLRDCLRALEALQPSDKRGELLHWNGAQMLNDTYNSNPRALDSMVDALTRCAGAATHRGCGRDAGAWAGGGSVAPLLWRAHAGRWRG